MGEEASTTWWAGRGYGPEKRSWFRFVTPLSLLKASNGKILSRLQRCLQIQEPALLLPALQKWTIWWERCQPMNDPPSTHLAAEINCSGYVVSLFQTPYIHLVKGNGMIQPSGVLDPPPTSFSLPLAVFGMWGTILVLDNNRMFQGTLSFTLCGEKGDLLANYSSQQHYSCVQI